MDSIGVLTDAYARIGPSVHAAVAGLSPEQLAWRADAEANSVAWLVWHLARVQDDHVSEVAGLEQVWTAQGWSRRFALPLHDRAIGYGHSSGEVATVHVTDPVLLTGYYDAVADQTMDYLRTLSDADLDRVVDEGWDPPVTLGVRLVSVVEDDLQHVGQAAFLHGVLHRS